MRYGPRRASETVLTEGQTGNQERVSQSRRGFLVSEGPWFGDPLPESGGPLNVHDDTGMVNRIAVHRAARYLVAGAGGDAESRKRYAESVIQLFREHLEESVPPGLQHVVRAII